MSTRLPPPQPAAAGSIEHRSVLADLKKEAELLTKYHREIIATGKADENDAYNANDLGRGEVEKDPNDDSEGQIERLHSERKQLLEWGENLYREVSRLERARRKLEQEVGKERDTTQNLETSNEQLLSKCMHLESILQGQTVPDARFESVSDQEHKDLRKQLSQYAVEIDNLRKENEAALEALSGAQSVAQQRVIERDSYFLTVEELEQNFQKLQEKYGTVEQNLENEKSKKKQCEDRLREAQLELDVMCASLKLARREAETHVQHLESVEKSLKEKSNLIIEVTDLIEPMRALFVKMQAAYASQTKEYSAFVEDIHARQRESGVALEVAKDEITVLETVTEHLRNELVRMKQEYTLNHNELEGQLSAERDGRTQQQKELELVKEEWEREREATEKQFQAKKDQLVNLKQTLVKMTKKKRVPEPKETNYSMELREISMGRHIEKIGDDDRKQLKFITVVPDQMIMQYKKSFPRRGNTTIDLTEVIRLEFGTSSRAYVIGSRKIHQGLAPWLCFSLYTPTKSYDFMVPEGPQDEYTIQCFILGLSALCRNASGVMRTRGQFIMKKALMKLDEGCKWKGITRVALIKEALLKTANQEGLQVAEAED